MNRAASCFGRIHRSWQDAAARAEQADVDRAVEVLGAADGRIRGTVRDLRRRWDTLLDELHPPPRTPTRRGRWRRRLGFGRRARAADVGLAYVFHGIPVGVGEVVLQYGEAVGGTCHGLPDRSPQDCLRWRIADALDEAYCELLPQEALRRAHERASFWAIARGEQRRREFVARCFDWRGRE